MASFPLFYAKGLEDLCGDTGEIYMTYGVIFTLKTGADGGNRTRTGKIPTDFKSVVSTNSTTSAVNFYLPLQEPIITEGNLPVKGY